MPMLSSVEAAIKLGVGVERIEYFKRRCPKYKDDPKSPSKQMDRQLMKDLLDHQPHVLNLPWPRASAADLPGIPKPIREDIKLESLFACAICGLMDNGEAARNPRQNLLPVTIELVTGGASAGNISERLKTLWGNYRETPVV